jgi:hypothetical protein
MRGTKVTEVKEEKKDMGLTRPTKTEDKGGLMRGAKVEKKDEQIDIGISKAKPSETKPNEGISRGSMITKGKTETTSTSGSSSSTLQRGVNVIKKNDDNKDSTKDEKPKSNTTSKGDNWRKK